MTEAPDAAQRFASRLKEIGRALGYAAALFLLALGSGVPARSVGAPLAGQDLNPGACQQTAGMTTVRAPGTLAEARIITVGGSFEEIGFQLGCLLQREIRAAVAEALSACAQAEDGHWRRCERRVAGLRAALSASLLEELQGMARGAVVNDMDLLVLNLALQGEALAAPAEQVTSMIAAWRQATLDGELYLGATLGHNGQRMWVERRPATGRRTVLLSRPGALGGSIGLNEDLLGAVAMPIRTEDTDDSGITASLALRLILEESSLPDEALAAALGLSYAEGFQILFGRGEAGVRGIEGTAHVRRELIPDMGTLASVGLYHDPELGQTQIPAVPVQSLASLQDQWDRLEQTLRTNVGWIGVEKALLGLEEMLDERSETVILFRPTAKTVWVGEGRPASTRLLEFQPLADDGVAGLP